MRHVRLFVSSPGDVPDERQRVRWIADRLSGELAGLVEIETLLWESSVYNAHQEGGFQPQIDQRARPADCDIVLAVFWSRLGTELADAFPEKMPDGQCYPSGTAYEVLTALEARKSNPQRPDVYVFRKSAIPTVPINDRAARDEADRQWQRLEDFFATHFELADKRILRAVERFRDMDEFESKVERLLRDWIKSNVSRGTVWSIEEQGSPFRGLEPFDARHADVFCGRDRKVIRALDELLSAARRGKPLLLMPGASGSGKSSLVRAGLAPRLVRPGTAPGVDVWRTAIMRPAAAANPLLALARALFVTGDDRTDDPGGFGRALPELAEGAFRTPDLLAELFSGPAAPAAAAVVAALDEVGRREARRLRFDRPLHANLLLIVDQLEEVFAESVSREGRSQFAHLLAALVGARRVWAVATLRGDLYGRLISEGPFVALKEGSGQYDLNPPGPDELDEIIHRSAEAAGLRYEARERTDGPDGPRRECLDDRLLRDAAGENTLPLLQFALDLLFEKCWTGKRSLVLDFAAYEEIGGLDGAINRTAEMALVRLLRPGLPPRCPPERDVQEEIARTVNPMLERLLRKLVVPMGRQPQRHEAPTERALTARIVPMAEACRDEATRRLVDALVQARVLLASQTAEGSAVRIAHDRVITSWDRARRLVEKNRDFYHIKESIETQQQRWEESRRSHEFLIPSGTQVAQAEEAVRRYGEEFGEDTRAFVTHSTRRARRRQRLLAMATGVFAVLALVATLSSYVATRQRLAATRRYETVRASVGQHIRGIAGKLRDREGVSEEAVEEALRQVADLVQHLENENRTDPELKRIRASMSYEFARVFQNAVNLSRAMQEAEEGRRGRQELVARPKAPPEWLAEHADSLEQVGDIHRARAADLRKRGTGDPAAVAAELHAAERLYREALEVRKRLFDAEPDKPVRAFALSQILCRQGDLAREAATRGDPAAVAGAAANYQNALDLNLRAIRVEPDNPLWQRELAWCLIKIADTRSAQKDWSAALDHYNQGLCVRRHIAARHPDNLQYRRDVAWCLEKMAAAHLGGGDRDRAREAFTEAYRYRRDLADVKKLWTVEFAESAHWLGQRALEDDKPVLAAGYFSIALDRLKDVEGERAAATAKPATELLHKAHDRLPAGGTKPSSAEALGKQGIAELSREIGSLPAERQSADGLTWESLKSRLLQGGGK